MTPSICVMSVSTITLSVVHKIKVPVLMNSHQYHPSVLREYDIRGIVGDTLSTADAYAVGRGIGSAISRKGGTSATVGYDGRLSSPEMAAALSEGLRDCGLQVQKVGLGPTPLLYFSVFHLGTDGGVMVTGSHNPPDYNGFKMMVGHDSYHGELIQGLGTEAAAGDWVSGRGTIEDIDLNSDYVAKLAAAYESDAGLNVVWDCGNGAGGEVVQALVKQLPGTHHLLNEKIDGTFPAHHPDPTVAENLVELQEAVAAKHADLGIAFDGDGDRIGVVDGQGRILWGDQLIAILARDVLVNHPGAAIIADVKASQVLFDEIADAGGKPVMHRTGHSHIKSKMKELRAPLAGEMSGHIFFADKYYGYDDAQYVAVRFLDLLARHGVSAAELYDRLPKVINTPEIRFDCADDRKFDVVDEVKAALSAAGADINDVDGVRVNNADGWWLLRASNTQPALVARCESKDQAGLARLKKQLATALSATGLDASAVI
jgi:phosphomannomutase